MTEPLTSQGPNPSGGTLGTFAGVFTPSILTILGIILFLRLGYVVGNAGLRNALIMIGIATLVSGLTSLSLAAISTNIEVKGGGDYYLISRTLGMEFGGAIGIVLYLAQTVSVAFYAIGFGEAVAAIAGWEADWAPQLVAAGAVLFLFVFAWAGANVATRFQFVVMALLVAALASFYAGAVPAFDVSTALDQSSPPTDPLAFWAVFAILFPAVTGFTQGVSMSGDLRNPGVSLPRGTFAAVGLSTLVYVSVAVLLAGAAPQSRLIGDTGVMGSVAAFGPLIDAGVVAATLSSAMASFLGAPRILQSMARDKVFPVLNPFAKGHGKANNPRRGVLLSLAIALATIALGSLNVIAPVVSMFFLVSYGLLNYATYYEARAQSPSFRPRFKYFSRRASLAGAVLCLVAMLAINPAAGVAAVFVLYAIYRYLMRRDRIERWTDTSRAHFFQRAKEAIWAMTREVEHPRNWRPQIIAFSADPDRRARLLRFVGWLEGGSGLTTVAQIVAGEGALKRRERDELHEELEMQLEALNLDTHVLTVLAPDPMDALPVIVQSHGIGPLGANTVVFGLPSTGEASRNTAYAIALRSVSRIGRNVIAVSSDEDSWRVMADSSRRGRVIDVWWAGDDTSRLSLLMAYLATRTPEWKGARIRVVVPLDPGAAPEESKAEFGEMLQRVRIRAQVEVVEGPTVDRLIACSSAASLALIPMSLRGTALLEEITGSPLESVTDRLPLVAAVMAAKPVDLAAGPESGPHADLLRAEERLELVSERHDTLVRQFAEAERDLEKLRDARASNSLLAGEVEVAEVRVDDLRRRVLQAEARIETAERELDEARDALR